MAAANPANEITTRTTNAITSSTGSMDSSEKALVRYLAKLITPRGR
jgi:hypothetical protein